MKQKSNIDVVVIHDDIKKNSTLITLLKDDFLNVELIDDPEDGLGYVIEHLNEKIIVVLDIDFGQGLNGYDVLKKIRDRSFLVKVIILSANDLPGTKMMENIHSLFGLQAFDYIIRKSGSTEILIESVQKAKTAIENSVTGAIDKWISVQSRDKREKPFLVDHAGRKYSLNDLKNEISLRTKEGLELEKKILMTAIKLLTKESD